MRSEYSPALASEKQAEENHQMLRACLILAGLNEYGLRKYDECTAIAAEAYREALGEGEEPSGAHSEAQFEAAKAASDPHQDAASNLLAGYGITITNKAIAPISDDYFPHIETLVCNCFDKMKPVAKIERPIVDIELELYKENSTGYGAVAS